MNGQAPLFWQAALFSTTALALVFAGTWWLYVSPMARPRPVRRPLAPRLAYTCATGLGMAGLMLVIGGFWDGSWHIRTGRIPFGADFLWAPHLLIYGSFLLTFSICGAALGAMVAPVWKAGIRDPRYWVRTQPILGAVVLASLYVLMAIPGDALWHELIGPDMTAWSPPHMILAIMTVAVTGSGVSLVYAVRAPRRHLGRKQAAIVGLLVVMLAQLHLVGVSEWEWSAATRFQVNRPLWLYPIVGSVTTGFILILGKLLIAYRWSATLIALSYFGLRAVITLWLELSGNLIPALPLPFVLGAFLLDLLPKHQQPVEGAQVARLASVFTIGYLLMALPVMNWQYELMSLGHPLLIVMVVATWLGTLIAMLVARQIVPVLLGDVRKSASSHAWHDHDSRAFHGTMAHGLKKTLDFDPVTSGPE